MNIDAFSDLFRPADESTRLDGPCTVLIWGRDQRIAGVMSVYMDDAGRIRTMQPQSLVNLRAGVLTRDLAKCRKGGIAKYRRGRGDRL